LHPTVNPETILQYAVAFSQILEIYIECMAPEAGPSEQQKNSCQHYPTIPRENRRNVHGAFIIIFKGTVTRVALMYAVKELKGINRRVYTKCTYVLWDALLEM
jgi:hypothetical protein